MSDQAPTPPDDCTLLQPAKATRPGYHYARHSSGALYISAPGSPWKLLAQAGRWPDPVTPTTAPTGEIPQSSTPSFSFVVPATLDGVAGQLTITAPRVNQIVRIVRNLRQHGLVATTLNYIPPVATHDGLLMCGKHSEPMHSRSKQGDSWMSHNVGTEQQPIWCKGRPGKDSPGWDHEMEHTR